MIKRFNQDTSVIGLDIGRLSIKAVQVKLLDKRPRLEGVLSLRRSGVGHTLDESEAARLSRAIERRGMTARQVVMVAPSEALVSGIVEVPPADADVARDKIVQSELSRTHQLPPGGFEFAWWDLPASSTGSRIAQAHAVALPHTAVEQTLDVLNGVGLNTIRTLPASVALLAAAQRVPIDPRCISAVIDLGSRKAQLALMHAGRVVHERTLPDFDLGALQSNIAEALGITEPQARRALGKFGLKSDVNGMVASETNSILSEALAALAEEVSISFAYVSHLYPGADLGSFLLVGGGASIVGLGTWLTETLELEASTLSPDMLVQSECFGDETMDPAMTGALGAALCGGLDHA